MSFIPLGVLCALSIAALVGAGLRVAARTGSVGLERVVAAVVLAAAAAVAQALGFGLVGLGSSPLALSLAAGLTWLLARLLLPPPDPRPRVELATAWGGLAVPWRIACVALAVGVAYLVYSVLQHPYVSFDAGIYHFPEVATWVQSGHPGQVVAFSYDYPFASYPLTDEVLMTWGAGIARSWVPAVLWPIAAYGVCAAAGWAGLRTLRVPRLPAGLAVAALLLIPWMVRQLSENGNDVTMTTWTVATAALCAGAARRPGLLPIALVSAGLALGTKTTPVVFIVIVLIAAGWAVRGELKRLAWPLLGGLALAVAVGGVWYLRNLIDHGSPVWPFQRLPGADPIPAIIDITFGHSLLSRTGPTLGGHLGEYAQRLGGGILLLVATPVVMALVRTRAVLLAGAATLIGLFVWARTPGTGLPTAKIVFIPEGFPLSTTRYLLPVLAAATLTVVLAARDGRGARRTLAVAVLLGAAVWSLITDLTLPSSIVPVGRVVGAALLGTAILVGLTGFWPDVRRLVPRATASARVPTLLGGAAGVALLAVVLGAILAPAGNGWAGRAAQTGTAPVIGLDAMRWSIYDAALRRHDRIAFAGWAMVGPLAGDRFDRRLSLVPPEAPCPQIRAAARRGWLVTTKPGFGYGFFGITPFTANRCLRGVTPRFQQKMRVYGPPAA